MRPERDLRGHNGRCLAARHNHLLKQQKQRAQLAAQLASRKQKAESRKRKTESRKQPRKLPSGAPTARHHSTTLAPLCSISSSFSWWLFLRASQQMGAQFPLEDSAHSFPVAVPDYELRVASWWCLCRAGKGTVVCGRGGGAEGRCKVEREEVKEEEETLT